MGYLARSFCSAFIVGFIHVFFVNAQFSNPPCTTAPINCPQIKYRTLEGTCNNLHNTDWGAYNRRYNRLVAANYADNIFAPAKSVTGKPLPSSRLVSTTMFGIINYTDPHYTLVNMQWGQIVAHDMGRQTPISGSTQKLQTCCQGNKLKKVQSGLNCFPIIVPKNDPVYAKIGKECLLGLRSVTDKNVKCPHNPKNAEQISATTSYMDLSIVYGNDKSENDPIRSFNGGKLIVVEKNGHCYPPQVPNATLACNGVATPNDPCYLTGDIRSNQSPDLALLQILLLREHNLLAKELASINPHWTDEQLFQVARSINIGQYQNINYYEWLPNLLGYDNMIDNKVIHHCNEQNGRCINDYKSNIDASIINEHSTAAFRNNHNQIAGYLQLLSQRHELLGSIRLSDWLNNPGIIEKNNHQNFLYLSIGLATQRQELTDTEWDAEVKHFLFRFNNTYGTDLKSIDIQRDLDHGIGTYNNLRAYCGFTRAKSWEDYTDFIPKHFVQKLKTIYESHEDVPLSVGGSLENLVANTMAGPTNLCIMTEQFYRTRRGDRFFFENCERYGLTERQLMEIRKVTAASIFCRNTDMEYIQKSVFLRSNNLVSCKKIPKLNLYAWKE